MFVLPRDWETLDFSFRSFPFFFSSLWVRSFFGAGRTGKARRKLLESSRGIFPNPCSPPHTRPGSRFWFPPLPPALLQDNKAKNAPGAATQPGTAGNVAGEASGNAQGRGQPGILALAQPSCAPGEPWALSCCCRSSANLSGSTKVVFPAGRGSPKLLEGPRPPMLLKSPAGRSQLLLQPRFSPHCKRSEFLFSAPVCMDPRNPLWNV